MKTILPSALAVATLAVGGWGQESRPAARIQQPEPSDRAQDQELIERRDEKLAGEWISLAPWKTDYDAARAEAKRSGKLIFAYFTRSYAA